MKPLFPLMAGATLLLGACAVYPEYDPYYDPPVVRVAPPPPRIEYVGPPPAVGYIWIEGYWSWVGTRYVWVPGRWEAPRPGYVWLPYRWERDGDHWRLRPGRWERSEPPRVLPRPDTEHRLPPPPHFEHRPPPAPPPAPQPRFESRPAPGIMPAPPKQTQPPRLDQESRRPGQLDPSQFPRRHANPPAPERFERDRGRPEERREERHRRDRVGEPGLGHRVYWRGARAGYCRPQAQSHSKGLEIACSEGSSSPRPV